MHKPIPHLQVFKIKNILILFMLLLCSISKASNLKLSNPIFYLEESSPMLPPALTLTVEEYISAVVATDSVVGSVYKSAHSSSTVLAGRAALTSEHVTFSG